jgi:hypothetical protein
VRFDVGGIDHLRVGGSPVPGKLPEQVFPDATSRPAHEAVINRRRRTINFRAIAPAAAAPEHVHDPADHAPVICSLDAAYIRRQMRFNPCPLFVAQPEQISAHQSFPPNTNQYRIVEAQRLMSSDPSFALDWIDVPTETKTRPRKVRDHGAWITFDGDIRSYECRVLGVSTGGAKLLADVDALDGSSFKLSVATHSLVRKPSEVVWRKGRVIGVRFAVDTAKTE